MSKPKVNRRNFLIAVGLGSAGAVAAAMAAKEPHAGKPEDSAAQPDSRGYRVSAHIRKYYHTTRT
jgi:hypothetical protein